MADIKGFSNLNFWRDVRKFAEYVNGKLDFLFRTLTDKQVSVDEQRVTVTKIGDSTSYLYDPGDFKFTVTKQYYASDFKLYLRAWTNTADGGSSGANVYTSIPFTVTNDGDHYTITPLATVISTPYGMSTSGTLSLYYEILV